MEDKPRSILGMVTGFNVIKKITGETKDNIVETGKFVKQGVDILIGNQECPIPENVKDDMPPAERFEEIAKARHVDDYTIGKRMKSYKVTCFAFMFVTLYILAYIIISKPYATILTSMLWFSCLFASTSVAVKYAYYYRQLAKRSLISIGDFISKPKLWLPLAVILMALGGSGQYAHASNYDNTEQVTMQFSTATKNDSPGKFVDNILGHKNGTMVTPSNTSGTAFTYLLGDINAFVFFCAMMSFTYFTIIGIAQTAHDGKVLGQEWNTMWAPIRVCWGIAFLPPIPGSQAGLSLGQYSIMSLWIGGQNFGTYLAKQGIEYATNLRNTTSGTQSGLKNTGNQDFGGQKLVHEVIESELCYQAYKTQITNQYGSNASNYIAQVTQQPDIKGQATTDGKETEWDYGDCGKITVGSTATVAQFGSLSSSDTDAIKQQQTDMQTFITARNQALSSLIQSVRSSQQIQAMVQSSTPGGDANTAKFPTNLTSGYGNLADSYNATVLKAATTLDVALNGNAYKRMESGLDTYGWPFLGAYFVDLAASSQHVANIVNSAPVDTSIKLTSYENVPGWKQYVEFIENRFENEWTQENEKPTALTGADFATTKSNTDGITGKSFSLMNKAINYVSTKIINSFTDSSDKDPITEMMWWGNTIIGIGNGIIAMAFAAGILSIPSFGLYIVGVGVFISPIVFGLYALGILTAFIMPMLAAMYVFYSFIACCKFAIEAMMAAPLWSFTFVRLDGQELIHQVSKAGIMLVANLAMRPAFSVIGFFAIFYIAPFLMSCVDNYFATIFIAQEGSSLGGVFTIMAGVTMLMYLKYQVIIQSINGITDYQAHVFTWIGAHARNYGEAENSAKFAGVMYNTSGKSNELNKLVHKHPKKGGGSVKGG
ncbi:DotA/TraY family protein [Komagataeibacter nataicola]|uniref:DotA/TraY family protein n=2 Tax=Komagataeibacter nataicola TaxID=265960 RepID=A0ABX5PDK3_9PROT|nr:DotA/TraY family protein [Komagataeibacter nataicola]PYD66287.1 hypothetical protein CDI09_09065 [Komagataeibacter nataicola]WNM10320.1 DotA/TraY family protein [Komagataeibacter nataicola]GBR23339.1 hypothetical protein AA0616_2496 [Komagataeibacter nataicola NRIC 0616]